MSCIIERHATAFLAVAAILVAMASSTCPPPPDFQSDPIVHTPSGDLKGSILTTWTDKKFFSFRGIPFAEPPVGDLRFKAPVPVKRWQGVKNATQDGYICPQKNSQYLAPADEDCLNLNVYTKNLKGNRPVIVFFHPGGFYAWTGASFFAGPQYLMDNDIVFVAANYRLDALGYLASGDKTAVGNYGMKDQVEVLRWIQKHIKSFGGNPNDVTIAGYSAGSCSGFLHMLSPMSRGLFHKVIAMSCGVTDRWLIMKDKKEILTKFAKLFNCPTDSTEKMIQCLRNVPAKEINSLESYEAMKFFADFPLVFVPTVEPDYGTGEERFLTDDPATLIRKKQFYSVPVVMGITKYEFLAWSQYVLNNDTIRNELINNFDSLLPKLFGYSEKNKNEAQEITDSFKRLYFGDKPLTKDLMYEVAQMQSDYSIYYGVYSTAKLLAQYSEKPVYFYKFDYKGRYGFTKDTQTNETIGPTHHDDLIYLIYISQQFPLLKESDPEAFMVKLETSIWNNFVTKGNPTPDHSPVQWSPLTKNNKKHLVIDTHLKMENGLPYSERLQVWETLLPV